MLIIMPGVLSNILQSQIKVLQKEFPLIKEDLLPNILSIMKWEGGEEEDLSNAVLPLFNS